MSEGTRLVAIGDAIHFWDERNGNTHNRPGCWEQLTIEQRREVMDELLRPILAENRCAGFTDAELDELLGGLHWADSESGWVDLDTWFPLRDELRAECIKRGIRE